MKEILTGVVVAVVSAYIISKLGIGNSRYTIATVQGSGVNKVWKILILSGAFLFFGGAYYGFSWASAEGFAGYRAMLGFSLAVLGLPLLFIGKIGAWWNRF